MQGRGGCALLPAAPADRPGIGSLRVSLLRRHLLRRLPRREEAEVHAKAPLRRLHVRSDETQGRPNDLRRLSRQPARTCAQRKKKKRKKEKEKKEEKKRRRRMRKEKKKEKKKKRRKRRKKKKEKEKKKKKKKSAGARSAREK